ncbi:hypothetical protein SS37A_10070 [Methylocystis iwaonis]|uniref:Uncharacterized protein n=1 Tax=Methylocystis iwaonis TaxID=2885079 RepID=A0ABN6VCW2_9HYPH|nr:hypothetical protein SS37A_10070 [Methylocystis iwaonis]
MSPPRDPEALSFPKIVFARACRKGWPHIEEGILLDKRHGAGAQGASKILTVRRPSGLDRA